MKKLVTVPLAAAALFGACGGAQAKPPAVTFQHVERGRVQTHVASMRVAERVCEAAERGEYGKRLRGVWQIDVRIRHSRGRDLTCVI